MEVMTRGVVTDVRLEKGTLVIVLQADGTRGRKRMITCFRKVNDRFTASGQNQAGPDAHCESVHPEEGHGLVCR